MMMLLPMATVLRLARCLFSFKSSCFRAEMMMDKQIYPQRGTYCWYSLCTHIIISIIIVIIIVNCCYYCYCYLLLVYINYCYFLFIYIYIYILLLLWVIIVIIIFMDPWISHCLRAFQVGELLQKKFITHADVFFCTAWPLADGEIQEPIEGKRLVLETGNNRCIYIYTYIIIYCVFVDHSWKLPAAICWIRCLLNSSVFLALIMDAACLLCISKLSISGG